VANTERRVHKPSALKLGPESGKGFVWLRAIRSAALVAILAVAVLVASGSASRLLADYADGYQTQHGLALEDAVKIWRRAAWQQDDFFSQITLGDLYSRDPSFNDPVEAYVWYFLALRRDHVYSISDDYAAQTFYDMRSKAIADEEKVFNSLTLDQRLEARSRIIYIFASRGSEGFIALGRLHRMRSLTSSSSYNPPEPPSNHVCVCGKPWWYFPPITWVRSLFYSFPPTPACRWKEATQAHIAISSPADMCPYPDASSSYGVSSPSNFRSPGSGDAYSSNAGGASSSTINVNSGTSNGGTSLSSPSVSMAPSDNGVGSSGGGSDYASGGSDDSGGYSSSDDGGGYRGGYSSNNGGGYGSGNHGPSSVMMRSNAEALMYFDVAANLGHPLGSDYAKSLLTAMSYNGDVTAVAAMAAARARNWLPPYEFYPGSTAGGIPHSDESLPSLAQRQGYSRVREIPVSAIMEALQFRGLLRGGRGGCWIGPACLAQAIAKFQSALNFEPTGFLPPPQVVRLIQMSAVDGDAISQNRLGVMYAKGIGVPRNFPRALEWFTAAAKQRYGEALYDLGVLYKVGPDGVPQDKDKAARLFTESALAGFNPARCELRDLLAEADNAERSQPGAARR